MGGWLGKINPPEYELQVAPVKDERQYIKQIPKSKLPKDPAEDTSQIQALQTYNSSGGPREEQLEEILQEVEQGVKDATLAAKHVQDMTAHIREFGVEVGRLCPIIHKVQHDAETGNLSKMEPPGPTMPSDFMEAYAKYGAKLQGSEDHLRRQPTRADINELSMVDGELSPMSEYREQVLEGSQGVGRPLKRDLQVTEETGQHPDTADLFGDFSDECHQLADEIGQAADRARNIAAELNLGVLKGKRAANAAIQALMNPTMPMEPGDFDAHVREDDKTTSEAICLAKDMGGQVEGELFETKGEADAEFDKLQTLHAGQDFQAALFNVRGDQVAAFPLDLHGKPWDDMQDFCQRAFADMELEDEGTDADADQVCHMACTKHRNPVQWPYHPAEPQGHPVNDELSQQRQHEKEEFDMVSKLLGRGKGGRSIADYQQERDIRYWNRMRKNSLRGQKIQNYWDYTPPHLEAQLKPELLRQLAAPSGTKFLDGM